MGSTTEKSLFDFRHERLISLSFSLSLRVGTSSGTHSVFYAMGITGFFPGIKRQGRDADEPAPYSAEVKNVWNYT
jgi:hypothetical protein